jgi:hypothetical protein
MNQLRPHQENAIQVSIENNFQSGVHFHATGTGKSWIALHLVLEYQKKFPLCNILWICEQKNILIEQFSQLRARGFSNISQQFLILNYSQKKEQKWSSIVNSSFVWKKPLLVIINRAFLTSSEKYKQLQIPIHLIIHDECHSIINKTTKEFYQWIFKTHPNARCIGFSATPHLELEPFKTILTQFSIYDALCQDMIVPPMIEWWKTNRILSFDEIGSLVQKRLPQLPFQKIIVWCGMIEHTYQLSEQWKKYFPGFLFAIDTSKDDLSIEPFYQAKEKAILFCASKHREGSDIPYLDGCIFLDKVEERTPKTFIQCMGRVLRKDLEGKKKLGWILDLKASSSMEVIQRIQPFIQRENGLFPWKMTQVNDQEMEVYQIHMILPKSSNDNPLDSDLVITREEICSLFIRKIPDHLSDVYRERLEEELQLYEQKNLFAYLIRALEILKISGNIPHITRGSCGSSLVCYLLGISHVDPIKYDISFARFLNVHRNTLPDIDFDFPYHRRKDIFFRIEERYPNQVARISNHVYYHEKSALREAIRQSGYHKMIPKHEIKKYLSTLSSEERKKILDKKKELEGTFHTYSLHCGGIVYYPDGVPKDLVLRPNQSGIVQQITLNKEDVAKGKHFKIDILSSRAISVLCDILGEGKSILFEDPPHDDRVFEMLVKGDNVGITLAESPLMRKTLMKFKPKCMDDLAICLSVIRPAAKDARNAEPDEIEENEMFIYDDDAIKMISRILDCSEGDADKFRRVFAKNDKNGIQIFEEILDEMMIQEEEKKEVLRTLGQLSFYSFCKSHAFSYAQLVYQLAYYKYHQPLLFWKAVLKHSESSYRKWVHLYEASAVGLDVSTPRRDVSVYANHRQNKIHLISSPLEQLKRYGYWVITEDHLNKFFPNCCFYPLENEWRINGIIASVKMIRSGNKSVCILYLGVGKKEYVEVVIQGLGFMYAKWVGCKVIARSKDPGQKVFEAIKYHFY